MSSRRFIEPAVRRGRGNDAASCSPPPCSGADSPGSLHFGIAWILLTDFLLVSTKTGEPMDGPCRNNQLGMPLRMGLPSHSAMRSMNAQTSSCAGWT